MALTMLDKPAEKKEKTQWPADICRRVRSREQKSEPLRRLDITVGE